MAMIARIPVCRSKQNTTCSWPCSAILSKTPTSPSCARGTRGRGGPAQRHCRVEGGGSPRRPFTIPLGPGNSRTVPGWVGSGRTRTASAGRSIGEHGHHLGPAGRADAGRRARGPPDQAPRRPARAPRRAQPPVPGAPGRRRGRAGGQGRAGRPGRPAVHHQAGPVGRLPLGAAGRPPGAGPAGPRLLGDRRPAHPGRLLPRRPGAVGPGVRPCPRLRRRPGGDPGPQRLRLRAVHRRAGHARRGRADGLHPGPGLRRPDPAPGHPAPRPAARGAVLHPLVRGPARRGPWRGRGGPRRDLPAGRDLRGRALERGHAGPDRGPAAAEGARHLRPVGDHRPQAGLHVNEDHFLVEVVDPDSGRPLPPGERGELVFTTLTKEAMPLLRYRTGDIASLDRSRCLCGRTLARMSKVTGRRDDMLVIRGVNVYPSEVEAVLVAERAVAPHYLLVVDRTGTMPRLVVAGEMGAALLQRLGLTTEVRVLPGGAIPRTEMGKAKRVVERTAGDNPLPGWL